MAKDSRMKALGVSGFNKPKRTPNHPTKSHVVLAKGAGCPDGKTIRFGQQGVSCSVVCHQEMFCLQLEMKF